MFHVFPQQTNYTFNPLFIEPCLKVEQSLHFYVDNWKASDCFLKGLKTAYYLFYGAEDHKN